MPSPMKTSPIGFTFVLFFLVISFNDLYGQQESDSVKRDSAKIFIVIKNDGAEFIGNILSRNAREILIKTEKLGEVIIPMHEVREIRELNPGEISSSGEFIPDEVFATRYFISTNGLPIEQGESYIQWNLYGPDFQFGVGKNFGIGVMTTWIGVPIIGSAKYSIPVADNVNIGVGTLLGTGSWAAPDFGIALPFAALTIGDRRTNVNFSGGYGAVIMENESEGRTLLSISGMAKISSKISLVFDSFIVPANDADDGFAILIPGIRAQFSRNKAFQLGFAGISANGELAPVPIPMVQWYRKL
jgi:hypothetical protein